MACAPQLQQFAILASLTFLRCLLLPHSYRIVKSTHEFDRVCCHGWIPKITRRFRPNRLKGLKAVTGFEQLTGVELLERFEPVDNLFY